VYAQADVLEHLGRTGHRRLAVHHPRPRLFAVDKLLEHGRIGEPCRVAREREPRPSQQPAEAPTELAGQLGHVEQESGPRSVLPALSVVGQAPAGHDAVQVRVQPQSLAPGVQHRNHTGLSVPMPARQRPQR
jgi:hypothetical protein